MVEVVFLRRPAESADDGGGDEDDDDEEAEAVDEDLQVRLRGQRGGGELVSDTEPGGVMRDADGVSC